VKIRHNQSFFQKNQHHNESASSALLKYIIENNRKPNDCKHPIDAVLEDLGPTLKNLPPQYQHLEKGKIPVFSVVQELECQAHFGSPATPHSSRDSWGRTATKFTHSAVPSYGNC
jgi:hypothetical protein